MFPHLAYLPAVSHHPVFDLRNFWNGSSAPGRFHVGWAPVAGTALQALSSQSCPTDPLFPSSRRAQWTSSGRSADSRTEDLTPIPRSSKGPPRGPDRSRAAPTRGRATGPRPLRDTPWGYRVARQAPWEACSTDSRSVEDWQQKHFCVLLTSMTGNPHSVIVSLTEIRIVCGIEKSLDVYDVKEEGRVFVSTHQRLWL